MIDRSERAVFINRNAAEVVATMLMGDTEREMRVAHVHTAFSRGGLVGYGIKMYFPGYKHTRFVTEADVDKVLGADQ